MERCTQLLDYLSGQSEAKIRFIALDMIFNIHSDATYLSETKARSRACGHFFLGWMPKDGEPIRLNGAFHVSMTILRFVVVSAAEVELGALYHSIIFRLTLSDMGHVQPQTPVHCDNTTAVGIVNNTIKRQRSRCIFSGLVTRWHKKCTNFTGTQVKRTWLITKASTTQALTMWLFALGTYIWKIPPGYYLGR
jgi:hypothetical protein